MKEEQSGADPSNGTRLKDCIAERHHHHEHGDQRQNAQKIVAPRRIQTEVLEVAGLKIEQEMVANPIAGKVWILCGKVTTQSKALHDSDVWPKVAPLMVRDLQLARLHVERAEHHPPRNHKEDRNGGPVESLVFYRLRFCRFLVLEILQLFAT